ncbi:MAG: sugar phosphate nucleotidyltransferase [Candidatus Colwellbacteria bacterium]|jgi:glucose-1-phosphate thymidylyltransferase|nr:sugar phosphate nucleotidyltransferase [Candidatus Colwellbacteria bacterium]MCK9497325.1 sugar phosphate nucleotidyltransferase [Candidatus Colwellbacteria bacterium]MDD3752333.1 sugar phosphate nucleotidyltransferase [Candidatus Colwellbacteria bacterium]MDD4818599.1 sugar phosphate nucleotidyltransferase [Candidatus Colwellbacteria bacterium]
MKGIILAGGRGTRLAPFTRLIKKELLPVYNKPLIYYPLMTLRNSGIDDVILVSDPYNIHAFLDVIGEGEDLGMRIRYAIQNRQLGIADAIMQAKIFFEEGEPVAVILGDNIFTENFKEAVKEFSKGACIAVTQVSDPERFGVVSMEGDRVVKIIEKPEKPESNWAAVGFYVYDGTVFKRIEKLVPSARGEYEITDVNNQYLQEGSLKCAKMKGEWFDAGTFDSLLSASNYFGSKK